MDIKGVDAMPTPARYWGAWSKLIDVAMGGKVGGDVACCVLLCFRPSSISYTPVKAASDTPIVPTSGQIER